MSKVCALENEAVRSIPAGIAGKDGLHDMELLALSGALGVRGLVNEIIEAVIVVGGRVSNERDYTLTPFTNAEIDTYSAEFYGTLRLMANENWIDDESSLCNVHDRVRDEAGASAPAISIVN